MPGGDRDFCTENRRRRRRKGLVAWGEALWSHAAKGTPREVSPQRRRREKQRGAALLRSTGTKRGPTRIHIELRKFLICQTAVACSPAVVGLCGPVPALFLGRRGEGGRGGVKKRRFVLGAPR